MNELNVRNALRHRTTKNLSFTHKIIINDNIIVCTFVVIIQMAIPVYGHQKCGAHGALNNNAKAVIIMDICFIN